MAAHQSKVLIIGLDGMRPDMFDPQIMPALAGLVERGTRLPDHHAVYPTHTRVNVSTLATGVSPGRHGVVANVFRLNSVSGAKPTIVDTSNYAHLSALDAASNGPAVRAAALGDLLDVHDRRVAVAATSSAGAGILWTRLQPYRVINVNSHYERADLLSLREKLGPVPPPGTEHRYDRQMYAARAVTDVFLADEDTSVVVLWLNEPDASLHQFGLGAPEVSDALAICDAAVAHVVDGLDARGETDLWNIIIISDHGHSTVLHHRSLGEYLDHARGELDLDGLHLATASDYVYVDGNPPPGQMDGLVRWIQEQPWTGAVFGSPEHEDLPGVLPLRSLWTGAISDRRPALAVSPAWSDARNALGVPGTVAALTEHVALRATHGSASPFELHAFLAMVGPAICERQTTALPTGAVDLLPTVCQLLGLDVDVDFDGRVLWEALVAGNGEPGSHEQERIVPARQHSDGFAPEIHLERVGRTTYVDHVTNGGETGRSV